MTKTDTTTTVTPATPPTPPSPTKEEREESKKEDSSSDDDDNDVVEEKKITTPIVNNRFAIPGILSPILSSSIRRTSTIALIFMGVGIALLVWYLWGDKIISFFTKKKPALVNNKVSEGKKEGLISSSPPMHPNGVPAQLMEANANETPETLLALANELKNEGIQLWGISQCSYTNF
jgi:hypothetical protein